MTSKTEITITIKIELDTADIRKAMGEIEKLADVQQEPSKKPDIESARMRQIIREEMLMQMFPGGILSKYLAASRG